MNLFLLPPDAQSRQGRPSPRRGGLPYEVATRRHGQRRAATRHLPRHIKSQWQSSGDHGHQKVPAAARRASSDSTAILLYLAEKTAAFLGKRKKSGPSSYPGSCSSQRASDLSRGRPCISSTRPPTGLDYAVCCELATAARRSAITTCSTAILWARQFIVRRQLYDRGHFSMGLARAAPRGPEGRQRIPSPPIRRYKRWFAAIEARPAVARAKAVGKDHAFKTTVDEETKRAAVPVQTIPRQLRSRR